MTGRTASDLILFGTVGLWIIVFLLAMRGRRAQFRCPYPSGFALRRPWEQSACLSLVGLLSLLLPLLIVSNDWHVYGAMRSDHWPHLLAFAGIGLAGAVLFWWMGRPMEFAVDEGRHTYRWSEGWFPFRQTRLGPLSDLEGVGAEPGGSSKLYLVYIARRGGTGRMVVDLCSSAVGAENYADELAAVLGVPRLAPGACRWPQFSERRQRAWAREADPHPPYRRCRRYRRHLSD